jgi:DNA-binding Lrp family transcriptional regulator
MTELENRVIDSTLLDLVQEEIPLVPRPYAELARRLDVAEELVLDRLSALHRGSSAPIRQIGAIFDSQALGYDSTLVAAKVPEGQLAVAAAIIGRHPGVSHNYRREGEYNLWYTLAVPPESRLGLARTVEILHRQSGADSMRMLPTLKMYKIGVKLDLGSGRSSLSPAAARRAVVQMELTPHARRMVRALQRDLAIVSEPFAWPAADAGVGVQELLATAELFRRRGIMRRFSAVLRHRELGFDANAMGVWVVPPEKQDAFGAAAAAFPEVSHCYLRPTYTDWPYSIFTMIHARNPAQAEAVLSAISAATGVTQYKVLYSSREYKKVRVKYFEPDIPEWEEAAIGH